MLTVKKKLEIVNALKELIEISGPDYDSNKNFLNGLRDIYKIEKKYFNTLQIAYKNGAFRVISAVSIEDINNCEIAIVKQITDEGIDSVIATEVVDIIAMCLDKYSPRNSESISNVLNEVNYHQIIDAVPLSPSESEIEGIKWNLNQGRFDKAQEIINDYLKKYEKNGILYLLKATADCHIKSMDELEMFPCREVSFCLEESSKDNSVSQIVIDIKSEWESGKKAEKINSFDIERQKYNSVKKRTERYLCYGCNNPNLLFQFSLAETQLPENESILYYHPELSFNRHYKEAKKKAEGSLKSEIKRIEKEWKDGECIVKLIEKKLKCEDFINANNVCNNSIRYNRENGIFYILRIMAIYKMHKYSDLKNKPELLENDELKEGLKLIKNTKYEKRCEDIITLYENYQSQQ